MVRDEVTDVVHVRAATGSSPMLVDAFTKDKGKEKKKGGSAKLRTTVAGTRTPRTAHRRSASTATASGT